MTTRVSLSPELEKFAADCVESGRFDSVDDVVRTALGMLRYREERNQRFTALVAEARDEARETCEIGGVAAELDRTLRRGRSRHARFCDQVVFRKT